MSLADFAASSLRPSERPASASETNELMALDDDDEVEGMGPGDTRAGSGRNGGTTRQEGSENRQTEEE